MIVSTFELRKPDGSHDCWVTHISDSSTGKLLYRHFFATETEARQWGNDVLNKSISVIRPFNITIPSPNDPKSYTITNHTDGKTTINTAGWGSLNPHENEQPAKIYGDFAPPPQAEKPEIEATCYICGNKFKPTHSWNHWTDTVTLGFAHCGRTEYKELTLTQATEVAKVGYLAFLK